MQVLRNETGLYSTDQFTAEAASIIRDHNTSQPLFLYLAHQAVHSGLTDGNRLQAPQHYVDRFPFIHNDKRRRFAGMVAALDDSVGAVVAALRDRDMYDDTVILFTTDNGGPANGFNANAANNFPLRGVKHTLWEGGVRAVGLIASPLLKTSGYVSNQMIHVCDWLPTLYSVAGGDPGAMGDLDGYDVWTALSDMGKVTRTEILHNIDPTGKGFAGLRVGDYKLLVGDVGLHWDGWYPPWQEPNDDIQRHMKRKYPRKNKAVRNIFSIKEVLFSKHAPEDYFHNGQAVKVDCGPKPPNAATNCNPRRAPCLYHIPSDPCEYNNIAADNEQLVTRLMVRIDQYKKTMVPPLKVKSAKDPAANPKYHNGTWMPWVEL